MTAVLLLALIGCKTDEAPGDAPPEVCNASSTWDGESGFVERTDSWGLTGITAVKMSAADLDGDGYADLVASEGSPHARSDAADGTWQHRVLMNVDDGAGGRTFVDRTLESGLFTIRAGTEGDGGDTRASQIHVFGDVDNDGDLDAFAGAYTDQNNADTDQDDRSEILLNDGTGTFTLAPYSDLWVPDGYATSGASFVDFDADGVLDLWVVGFYERYGYLYGEQDRLYKGNGDGTFTDVTEGSGLEMARGDGNDDWIDGLARRSGYGATSCDLDGDAWPDLLATNYGRAWNQQWMNEGDGTFTDLGMESGFSDDTNTDYVENQFYACYCAYNGPCDPDPGSPRMGDCETFQAYWTPGWDDEPVRNNGNSFSTACGDIDNDGDMDLMTAEIVHWHIGDSSDPSELLLNDGTGSFTRPGNETNGLAREWDISSWNEGDIYVAFTDLDADGWKDIVLASSDYEETRLFTWRQVSPGQFEEIGVDIGLDQPWPAGLAIADFDRDGDLDLITGSSHARSGSPWEDHQLHMYESELGPGNRVRLRLQGDGANKAGIGARVQITAGDLVQTVQVDGGYGHFGMHHDAGVVQAGLDDHCGPVDVTVTWPGGAVDSYTGVVPNYLAVLAQGGGVTYPEWSPEAGE